MTPWWLVAGVGGGAFMLYEGTRGTPRESLGVVALTAGLGFVLSSFAERYQQPPEEVTGLQPHWLKGR